MEIVEAGIGPLNDLIAALHTKLLVARLGATPRGAPDREPLFPSRRRG